MRPDAYARLRLSFCSFLSNNWCDDCPSIILACHRTACICSEYFSPFGYSLLTNLLGRSLMLLIISLQSTEEYHLLRFAFLSDLQLHCKVRQKFENHFVCLCGFVKIVNQITFINYYSDEGDHFNDSTEYNCFDNFICSDSQ